MPNRIKNIAVLSPLLTLLMCSAYEIEMPIVSTITIIDCPTYGPFSETDVIIPIKFTYQAFGIPTLTVQEKITYDIEGLPYSKTSPTHSIRAGTKYQASLNFDPSLFRAQAQTHIMIQVINTKNNAALYVASFDLHRFEGKTINTKDGDVVESYPSMFSLLKEGFVYKDKYDFRLLKDVVGNKNYYEIDLSDQIMSYESIRNFYSPDKYLFIEDPKHVFQHLYREGDYVFIPINTRREGQNVRFSFQKANYDKETFQMYEPDPPLNPNLPSTTSFFLPLKEKDYFDGKKMYLFLGASGVNRDNIIHELTYYSGNNLFGDCDTSDYCITGVQND